MPAARPDPAALVRAGLAVLGLVAVGARLAAHHLDGEPYLPPALTGPARRVLGRRRPIRPSPSREHRDMPPDAPVPISPAAAWDRRVYLPPEGFAPTVAELTRLADTLAQATAGGDVGQALLAVEVRSDRAPGGEARLVYGWYGPPPLLGIPKHVWPTITAAPLADLAAGRLDGGAVDTGVSTSRASGRPAAHLGGCAARAELTLTGPATEAILVDIAGAQTPITELARVFAELHPDHGEYALVSVALKPLPPAEADQVRAWAARTLAPGPPLPTIGQRHKALLVDDGAGLFNVQVLLCCWADDHARAQAAVAAMATAFAASGGHNTWGMLPGPATPPRRALRSATRTERERTWFDARLLGGAWGPARPMLLTSVELGSLLTPPTRACPAPNVLRRPAAAPSPAQPSSRRPAAPAGRAAQLDDPGARVLAGILEQFGIAASVTDVTRGPTLTRYQLTLTPGTKVAKLLGLAQDLAVAFGQPDIRMVAPIPGRPGTIGVEIPHPPAERSLVTLDQILYPAPAGRTAPDTRAPLTVAVGADLAGAPVTTDLARLPHLLLAGTTGSGKTLWLNGLIASLLLRNPPDRLQLVLIDPKRVEFAGWAGVAHLRTPVITHPARAADALEDVVEELDRRLGLLEHAGVRTIGAYNAAVAAGTLTPTRQPTSRPLPYLVVVIDELADLLLVAGSRVEDAIQRIAQIARAVGIHLVIATQRPSVDVVTGVIKANIPARIAFMVASAADSRVILDTGGADKLIGDGDLLWLPAGTAKPARLQGPFLPDGQLAEIADVARHQPPPDHGDPDDSGRDDLDGEDGP